MSADGTNILKAVKQLRAILVDTGLLLKTIDGKMEKAGWPLLTPYVTEFSYSVNNPEKWFPSELFRFYKSEKSKSILPFVSVILDDDREGEYTISEPLVTAGYFDYGKNEVGNNWHYWYAKWHRYQENPQNDGQIIRLEPSMRWKEDWEENYPFEASACFGWPLTSITNEKDVETKIVFPLLNLLNR